MRPVPAPLDGIPCILPSIQLSPHHTMTANQVRTEPETLRVVLLYRRHQAPDEHVLHLLEKQLAADGYEVFVDRHVTFGVDWVREIEGQLRTADVVVPLLSEAAVQSEMMEFEIANAHEA